MNEIIILILVSFFTGISVKIVDLIEDEGLRLFKFDKYLFAIVYGILIGFVISNYDLVASLWIGTIFAMILAKKIDSKTHIIGLIFVVVYLFFFSIGNINLILLIIFLIIAFIDEIINDLVDNKPILKNPFLQFKKIKMNEKLKKVLSLRPLLEISALIVSIIINNYSLFYAILFFDMGYQLSNVLLKK